MPRELARAVDDVRYWFVIGGQAVRCFAPFRPSRDVDFGVESASDLEGLLEQLERSGEVVLQERSEDTVHLAWNGIKVSGFVLELLVPFVEERHLDLTGLLATKLHAILDRGLRRDFFDLYVLLEQERLGIAALLAAIRRVYPGEIDDGLLLRALTYFDDADREAALPGEGSQDWSSIKEYFLVRVGSLLAPPPRRLEIQERKVDVVES
jgi:Nucleotidyl transferase AbiEii toxin, Type IV TA system